MWELAGIFEVTGQGWARRMGNLLGRMHVRVQRAKAAGEGSLAREVPARYERVYRILVDEGVPLNPPPKTRGTPRKKTQSPPRSLVKRLHHYQVDYLRFAHDFQVPFDSYQAGRDLRMVRLQLKISGSWRSREATEAFLAVRFYRATARNQGKNAFDSLTGLFGGDPWLPAIT